MERSDKQLLEAVLRKEESAFNELYRRYWRLLYQWTFSRIKDREMVQDVMQIFWMQVWDQPQIIKTDSKDVARSFMLHVLSYRILDYLKSAESRLMGTEAPEIDKTSDLLAYTHVLEELEVKDLHKEIDRILDTLPEVARKVYLLRERKNLSVKETADLLLVSEKTVRNNLSLVFVAIRKQLSNIGSLFFLELFFLLLIRFCLTKYGFLYF